MQDTALCAAVNELGTDWNLVAQRVPFRTDSPFSVNVVPEDAVVHEGGAPSERYERWTSLDSMPGDLMGGMPGLEPSVTPMALNAKPEDANGSSSGHAGAMEGALPVHMRRRSSADLTTAFRERRRSSTSSWDSIKKFALHFLTGGVQGGTALSAKLLDNTVHGSGAGRSRAMSWGSADEHGVQSVLPVPLPGADVSADTS